VVILYSLPARGPSPGPGDRHPGDISPDPAAGPALRGIAGGHRLDAVFGGRGAAPIAGHQIGAHR